MKKLLCISSLLLCNVDCHALQTSTKTLKTLSTLHHQTMPQHRNASWFNVVHPFKSSELSNSMKVLDECNKSNIANNDKLKDILYKNKYRAPHEKDESFLAHDHFHTLINIAFVILYKTWGISHSYNTKLSFKKQPYPCLALENLNNKVSLLSPLGKILLKEDVCATNKIMRKYEKALTDFYPKFEDIPYHFSLMRTTSGVKLDTVTSYHTERNGFRLNLTNLPKELVSLPDHFVDLSDPQKQKALINSKHKESQTSKDLEQDFINLYGLFAQLIDNSIKIKQHSESCKKIIKNNERSYDLKNESIMLEHLTREDNNPQLFQDAAKKLKLTPINYNFLLGLCFSDEAFQKHRK